jgi:hypothetical protein
VTPDRAELLGSGLRACSEHRGECYDTRKFVSEGKGKKQQILKAIEDLLEDAGVEDALERLYLLYEVEKGLAQADRGELIPQQEVRRRMAKWLG